MINNLIIGGSTGDFYRLSNIRNTDNELSKYFVNNGSNAVEIMFYDLSLKCDITRKFIEKYFTYCSIHAPIYEYQDDEQSHKILKYLESLCLGLPIKNIVFHPDTVVDWSFFDQYKHLPLSIENMDEAKHSCQGVKDIQKIFESNPYLNFTLDLQHCFVNDPTMQLAKDFHKAFGDRLVEYHLSGYHPEYLHYPLYQTQQNQIINAMQNFNTTIIIESTFDEKNGLGKEIEFIQNFI